MSSEKSQNNHLEIEVKFFLTDPVGFEERVNQIGAKLTQPRVLEKNLRFDTPDGRLRSAREVLRLRMDTRARLTFKGPAQADQPVAIRPEIEFTVSDFEQAHQFLNALGFSVGVIYEKYRTAYTIGDAEISLDEMPFGNFCEIEAGDAGAVRLLAEKLGLKWEDRILASYLQIFDTLKIRRGWTMRDLTFENFTDLTIIPEDLQPKS
jgi:adenylate cyclase class 2